MKAHPHPSEHSPALIEPESASAQTNRAWLTLSLAHVRVDEYLELLERFGSVEDIAQQKTGRLQSTGLAADKCAAIAGPDATELGRAEDWLAQPGHQLVTYGSHAFPDLLGQIPSPPLVLYVAGDPDVLHLPAIAIVGSRNPTESGKQNAFDFAQHLGRTGFAVVSGLAQGIDAAAHRGALDANATTVALLGHGIDSVYPAMHRQLAHDIAKRGALVSEYPLGTPPERRHFPERNRLISGLSLGTLVVEAARRSGSLITARLAAEQGREVFAVPGSIHNPLSRGCHELIRSGGKLVETGDDIVSELAPLTRLMSQNLSVEPLPQRAAALPDADYAQLHRTLGFDPMTVDEIAHKSGLTIAQVSSMLLILELEGSVESLSGGRYSLLRNR